MALSVIRKDMKERLDYLGLSPSARFLRRLPWRRSSTYELRHNVTDPQVRWLPSSRGWNSNSRNRSTGLVLNTKTVQADILGCRWWFAPLASCHFDVHHACNINIVTCMSVCMYECLMKTSKMCSWRCQTTMMFCMRSWPILPGCRRLRSSSNQPQSPHVIKLSRCLLLSTAETNT